MSAILEAERPHMSSDNEEDNLSFLKCLPDISDHAESPNTSSCHFSQHVIFLGESQTTANGASVGLYFDLSKPTDSRAELEQRFNKLAEKWYRDTRMLSFISQKAMHPCYQSIIGMGKDALPFIFRELSKGKGDWIWALEHIALPEKNPVPENATFKDSVALWMKWLQENEDV
jgi:hypothetical protein